jgi:hypothetical protein
MRVGEVLETTFRYLGTVRAGDVFHIFARLDPYEQSELRDNGNRGPEVPASNTLTPTGVKVSTRSRRVGEPN